jgi:hypothetical protein
MNTESMNMLTRCNFRQSYLSIREKLQAKNEYEHADTMQFQTELSLNPRETAS